MLPRINYTSNSGASRWITISLVALLLASAAFVAWAVYATRSNDEKAKQVAEIGGVSKIPGVKFNCPLDGTKVDDRAAAGRRPIVVQVDNAPPARPQVGLSRADIVYEAMAEGDVTRFSAIFACHESETVGPVRSSRLITLELAPEYSALLADSGGSEGVNAELTNSDIARITHPAFPDAFWRVDDRFAPHNLMTSTEAIRQAAAGADEPVTATLPSLSFKEDKPAPAVANIGITYSGSVDVGYRYDAGSNSWLRFLGGEPHIDALTGEQIRVKNVIIQYVDISESGIVEDVGGNVGLAFGLTGSGPVQIFRDGQQINGTWKREGRKQITSYADEAGKPIALNRGLTFIQVVPKDFQPSVS